MKTAVMTDSNSGITPEEGKKIGIYSLPMPVIIEGDVFYEGKNITQEEYYGAMTSGKNVTTSQPSPGDVMDMWDGILKEGYEQVVYIPMSSALSASCHAAIQLSEEYDGKVQVVDDHRISVTMRESVLEAKWMANQGMTAEEIKKKLEENAYNSSIYIAVDTLEYLKKGGRVTAAGAAIGTSAWNQTSFTDPWREAGCICEDKRCQTGKEKDDRSSKKRVRRAFPRWRFW